MGAPVVARLFSNGLARGLRSAHGRPLLWLLQRSASSPLPPGASGCRARMLCRVECNAVTGSWLAKTAASPEEGNNEATATK